jgi:hypothetical protein
VSPSQMNMRIRPAAAGFDQSRAWAPMEAMARLACHPPYTIYTCKHGQLYVCLIGMHGCILFVRYGGCTVVWLCFNCRDCVNSVCVCGQHCLLG